MIWRSFVRGAIAITVTILWVVLAFGEVVPVTGQDNVELSRSTASQPAGVRR